MNGLASSFMDRSIAAIADVHAHRVCVQIATRG
jgi:hypothetical protein